MTSNPTLLKINGVYHSVVTQGLVKRGDVWKRMDNGEVRPFSYWVGKPVAAPNRPVYRPVAVPSGYRIRELSETVRVGDCAAEVHGDGQVRTLPAAVQGDPWVNRSVRDCAESCARVHGVQDFIVLAPLESPAKPKTELDAHREALSELRQLNLDLVATNDRLRRELETERRNCAFAVTSNDALVKRLKAVQSALLA